MIRFIYFLTIYSSIIFAENNSKPINDYFFSLTPQSTDHLTNNDYIVAESTALHNLLFNEPGERNLFFLDFSNRVFDNAKDLQPFQLDKIVEDLRIMHGKVMQAPSYSYRPDFSLQQLKYLELDSQQKNLKLLLGIAKDFGSSSGLNIGVDSIFDQLKDNAKRRLDEKNILKTQDDSYVNMLNSGTIINQAYRLGLKYPQFQQLYQKTVQMHSRTNLWVSAKTNLSANPHLQSVLKKQDHMNSYQQTMAPIHKKLEENIILQKDSKNKFIPTYTKASLEENYKFYEDTRSSVILLSNLLKSSGDLEGSRALFTLGNSTIDIAKSIEQFNFTMSQAGAGAIVNIGLAKLNLVVGIGSAVVNLFNLILGGGQKDTALIVLEQIKKLSVQIQALHYQMHLRFDHLDRKMDRLFLHLQQGFEAVLRSLNGIQADVTDIKENTRKIENRINSIDNIILMYFKDSNTILMQNALRSCDNIKTTQSQVDFYHCISELSRFGNDIAKSGSYSGDYQLADIKDPKHQTTIDMYTNLFDKLALGFWANINTLRETSIIRWGNTNVGNISQKVVNLEILHQAVNSITDYSLLNISIIKRQPEQFYRILNSFKSSLYELNQKTNGLLTNLENVLVDYGQLLNEFKNSVSESKNNFQKDHFLTGYDLNEPLLDQEPQNSEIQIEYKIHPHFSKKDDAYKELENVVLRPAKNIDTEIIPKEVRLAVDMKLGKIVYHYFKPQWIWEEVKRENAGLDKVSAHLAIPVHIAYVTQTAAGIEYFDFAFYRLISEKRYSYAEINYPTKKMRAGHGKTEVTHWDERNGAGRKNENANPPPGSSSWLQYVINEMQETPYRLEKISAPGFLDDETFRRSQKSDLVSFVKKQISAHQANMVRKFNVNLLEQISNGKLKQLALGLSGSKKMMEGIIFLNYPITSILNGDIRSIFSARFSLLSHEVFLDYLYAGCSLDPKAKNTSQEHCQDIYIKNNNNLEKLKNAIAALSNTREVHPLADKATTNIELLEQIKYEFLPKAPIHQAYDNLRKDIAAYLKGAEGAN